MSRLIATERRRAKAMGANERSVDLLLLRSLCLEAHRHCLSQITHTLGSSPVSDDVETLAAQERTALLLACAQITQTAATLIEVCSDHLPRILSSCADTCASCADVCSADESNELPGQEACVRSCLECADACVSFLSHSTLAGF